MPLGLDMHLGDQGTGGVQGEDAATFGLLGGGAGRAMRREHQGPVGGAVRHLLDEHRAQGGQALDHAAIVHDFVTDIDRSAVFGDRPLDHLDRPVHARAKAARTG